MAKSTSRIAFFVTIPMSIRIPMSTGMETALLVRISAAATPPMASGSEKRMVKGWMTEPKSRISTVSTSMRPMIIAFPKLCHEFGLDLGIARFGDSHTLGGSSTVATISLKRSVAVPSATPTGRFAPMVAFRSRFSRSMEDGPSDRNTSATLASGTVAPDACGNPAP
jgi:hypothetical protein